MDNKITIESMDAVIKRVPKTTYQEAKKALEQTNGDIIQAVILLESKNHKVKSIKYNPKENIEDVFGKDTEQIKTQIKELISKSSSIRLIIEKNGKTIINIPLTIGAIGAVFATIPTILGLSAAVITKYRIKIGNEDDGTVVDLGMLTEEKLNILKYMLINTAKEVKDTVVDNKKDRISKDNEE